MTLKTLADSYLIRNFWLLEHFQKLTLYAKNSLDAAEFLNVWVPQAIAVSRLSYDVLFANMLGGNTQVPLDFYRAINSQINNLSKDYTLIADNGGNLEFNNRINNVIFDPTSGGGAGSFGYAGKPAILRASTQEWQGDPYTALYLYATGYTLLMEQTDGTENSSRSFVELVQAQDMVIAGYIHPEVLALAGLGGQDTGTTITEPPPTPPPNTGSEGFIPTPTVGQVASSLGGLVALGIGAYLVSRKRGRK